MTDTAEPTPNESNDASKKRKSASTDDQLPDEPKACSSASTDDSNSSKKAKVVVVENPKDEALESNGKSSTSTATTASTTASTASPKKNNDEKKKKKTKDNFKPLDLAEIKIAISKLPSKLPSIPEAGLDPSNKDQVRTWAMSTQAVIEEFTLLLICISAATYKWGSDRTGAADQNLSLLSSELGNAQEQISASVTQRLTNVLAPVVELCTKETIVKKVKDEETGEEYEKRINTFSREENDPAFIHLCHVILCRNAVMLKHLVLTNFQKVIKCIQDYLDATTKDGNHNRSAFY